MCFSKTPPILAGVFVKLLTFFGLSQMNEFILLKIYKPCQKFGFQP